MTEDHGRVRHVVLNRPEKRNAFNAELIAALARARRAAVVLRQDELGHGGRVSGRYGAP